MTREIDQALHADNLRRGLVSRLLGGEQLLEKIDTSSFLLLCRDLSDAKGTRLNLCVHPTIRHFCLRVEEIPRAVFIIDDFTSAGLKRAKAEFSHVRIEGNVSEHELFHGLARRMLRDWFRRRVIFAALAMSAIAVPSILSVELQPAPPTGAQLFELKSSLGTTLTAMITVGAAYLAIFALYSGLSQATLANRTNEASAHAFSSYNAERVMLGWVLLSIASASAGLFVCLSIVIMPEVRYVAEALTFLSLVTIIPPLVDVIPYFVGRNYDLLLMTSVTKHVRAEQTPTEENENSDGGEPPEQG